jgi:hypothetical protein
MAKKFLSLAVVVKLRRSQQSPVTMTLAFDFKKMPKNSDWPRPGAPGSHLWMTRATNPQLFEPAQSTSTTRSISTPLGVNATFSIDLVHGPTVGIGVTEWLARARPMTVTCWTGNLNPSESSSVHGHGLDYRACLPWS